MITEYHLIVMKLLKIQMDYSKDSKASKRCFCNQFEKVADEYFELLLINSNLLREL